MTRSDAGSAVPPHRARRMLAALIGGANPDEIGLEENLGTDDVERALGAALDRRRTPTLGEFAKIQIARLETFFMSVMDRVEAGELAAIDRALKIIDRLDRYHGFHRVSPGVQPYTEEHRERLLAKINAVADNLADADFED